MGAEERPPLENCPTAPAAFDAERNCPPRQDRAASKTRRRPKTDAAAAGWNWKRPPWTASLPRPFPRPKKHGPIKKKKIRAVAERPDGSTPLREAPAIAAQMEQTYHWPAAV